MQSKYIGRVYDGMWVVVATTKKGTNLSYIVENTYNKNQYRISAEAMRNLDAGKTTMSSIIHSFIKFKMDNRIKK